MKTIKLTKGMEAIVDDCDFELISNFKWHASIDKRSAYAHRKVRIGGRKSVHITMHSVIIGVRRGFVIDHIDGNGLNNTRSNLRHCTTSENLRNSKNNKIKGVYQCQSKLNPYFSSIYVNGKSIHLGRFNTKIECAAAYNASAIKYFGEFASLNDLSTF